MQNKPFLGVGPGYQYAKPGDDVEVMVFVHNKDVDLPPTEFRLFAYDMQEGADGFFEPDRVTVPAGGQVRATLKMKMRPDAVVGQHLIRIAAIEGVSHDGFTHCVVHVQ